jgi:site-specific DNA-cytosine methylase
MLRVLSLFSGVGGFDMGLEQAGMRTVFQCEIDPHCQQTLQHHWPDVPKWGDITTLTGRHILENCDGVDVVAWGSPCQDLSVAGKRAGLEGERSGLFHQGIRIIKELQEISHGQYPTWSIWENVAGALSSNAGSDFGQVLWEMDEAGACFSEWRILDAQYFGVPQRRRRVFVISRFHLGRPCDSGCEVSVIGESSGRDSSTGDTQKQNSAGEVVGCLRSGGAGGVPSSRGEHLVVENPILIDRAAYNQGVNAQYEPIISDDPVVPSLVARGPHAVATGFGNTGFDKWSEQQVAVTLSARDYKSPNNVVREI